MANTRDSVIAQSWTTNAGVWTQAVRNGAIESRKLVTNQAVVDAVLRHSPATALDVGCGEGWLVRALAERGVQATGVDGSPGLIEAARASGSGDYMLCCYEDLVSEPAQVGGPYDVIVANFALLQQHLESLLQALGRRLVPEGRLIIQTVHPNTVERPEQEGWREEDFRSFQGTWQAMPWYYRSPHGWRQLLEDTGYRVESIHEPVHPGNQQPLSLILTACPYD